MKLYIHFIFLLFSTLITVAQNTDCATSTVAACNGNPTFPFTSNSGGNSYGNVDDLPTGNSISNPSTNPASSNSGCLFSGESSGGATWVQINISSSGTLQFNISQSGFVDWAMWPYNNTACAEITNNTLPPIRCNWNSSASGGTGIGPPPAGGTASNFEPTLNVTAGQSFIVCVTNFSNVNSTVNMNFSGTAGTSCVPYGSSTSQSICPGKTATLTASSNLGTPSYTWNPGGLNTQTINVSPAATTIYTVTIAGTNTVTNTFTTQVSTSTVTVYSLPTLTLSINSLVCPNAAITLSASTNFTSYIWTGPPAFSQTTTANAAAILNASNAMVGTYTVIAKTAQGCTVQATNTVGLIATTPITVTPIINLCQGGTVNLTAIATGATSYNWTGPLGFTSPLQNPSITNITPAQSGVYTVRANFASGVTTCTTINTTNVVVTAATTVALNPMPIVCNNGNINLVAPNGGNTYNWTGPNSYTSSIQSPIVSNAGVLNGGVYSLSVTTNGCVNTGTVNVSVYPVLNFTLLPTPLSLCVGKQGSITTSGNGGSGLVNYNWNPTTGLSAPNSPVTNVTGVATTTYVVTLSDANCPITVSPTTAVVVVVNTPSIITMSTTVNRGCEPFCTDLVSMSNPPSVNCQWSFSNQLATTACNTPSFCFNMHGNYDAKLITTDVNGCVDSLKIPNFILVDPKPFADFAYTPGNASILINEVAFEDKSTVGLPMTNWTWDFDDNYLPAGTDTSSIQNPVHLYNNVNAYNVQLIVTNKFGCIDSITKPINIENEFAFYIPNSFTPHKPDGKNDVFNVAGMGFNEDGFEMAIYDRWGALLFKTNDVRKGWDGSVKGGGTIVKQDVYIYKIKVIDYRGKEKNYVGHITLL